MTGLVFPASAGINRKMLFENAMPRGVPRGSGDKPQTQRAAQRPRACSPRQRG